MRKKKLNNKFTLKLNTLYFFEFFLQIFEM